MQTLRFRTYFEVWLSESREIIETREIIFKDMAGLSPNIALGKQSNKKSGPKI